MSQRSPMMDKLYGELVSQQVYERLQSLDPELNELIQRVAYDIFWFRPGLSLRDKALITVVSLITLSREEQTKIHINGFLNAGGAPSELFHVLLQIAGLLSADSALQGLAALRQVLNQNSVSWSEDSTAEAAITAMAASPNSNWRHEGLSLRDTNLIAVAVAVTVGNISASKTAIKKYLKYGGSFEDLRSTILHLIVYCGFPVAMNGFAALHEAQKELTD